MKAKILGLIALLLVVMVAAFLAVSFALGRHSPFQTRNAVQIGPDGQPVVTHVMQLWSETPAPAIFVLEDGVYTDTGRVVARIGELMKQKPFPYIRVRVGPPAWGHGEGQKVLEELMARCRKIGFINLEFHYDLTAPPKEGFNES